MAIRKTKKTVKKTTQIPSEYKQAMIAILLIII